MVKRFNHKRKRRRNGLGKVKKDIKWLKNNVEFKFKDLPNVALEAANAATQVVLLNGVGQGPDVDERSGDEVTARRITIRGTIRDGPTPTDATVRIIICRRKASRGTTMSIGALLDGSQPFEHAFRNMNNKSDFKVYADHTFTMDTTQHSRIFFKLNYKLDNKVRYLGSGTLESDMQENALYFIAVSNLGTGSTAPDINFTSRFYYCDS